MLFPRPWRFCVPLFIIFTITGVFLSLDGPLEPRLYSFDPDEDTDQVFQYKLVAPNGPGSHYYPEQQVASSFGDALFNTSNSVEETALLQSALDRRVQPIPNDTPTLFQARCKGEAAIARMRWAGNGYPTTGELHNCEITGWTFVDYLEDSLHLPDDTLDGPFPNYRVGAYYAYATNNKEYIDRTATRMVI